MEVGGQACLRELRVRANVERDYPSRASGASSGPVGSHESRICCLRQGSFLTGRPICPTLPTLPFEKKAALHPLTHARAHARGSVIVSKQVGWELLRTFPAPPQVPNGGGRYLMRQSTSHTNMIRN